MSEENVEIVRRGYEVMTQYRRVSPTGMPPIGGFLAPEFEGGVRASSAITTRRGMASTGSRAILTSSGRCSTSYRTAPEEFIKAGEARVLVFLARGVRE